jgi:hypothetical protein
LELPSRAKNKSLLSTLQTLPCHWRKKILIKKMKGENAKAKHKQKGAEEKKAEPK